MFAFADEWWKNYDNLQRPGNYWYRQAAPHDELSHEQDPEEHYGILTADRKPNPAYYAVQRMYQEERLSKAQVVPAVVISLPTIVAPGTWYRGKRR